MNKLLITIVLVLTSISPALAEEQVCDKGACFNKSTLIDGKQYPLLGIKTFRYLFFNIYTLALYGPEGANSVDKILSPVPKKLIFHYRREIKKSDMTEGADKNLEENPEVDRSQYKEFLDEINALYEDVDDGDRYSLEHTLNSGVSLYKGDKLLKTIGNPEFAKVYFGIWLSNYPLSKGLRDGLLNYNK